MVVTIWSVRWGLRVAVWTLRRRRRRRNRRAGRFGRAVAAAAVAVALDRAILAAVDADLLDPARIGIQHLDLEAGRAWHQFAAQRQPADLRHQIAADGIDLLGCLADVEGDADRGGDVVEARARVGDERAVGLATTAGSSSSSCSSAISPTICSTMSSIETRPSVPPYSSTTSARWMRVACIFSEQVERRHRRRHEQHLAHDPGRRKRHREIDRR